MFIEYTSAPHNRRAADLLEPFVAAIPPDRFGNCPYLELVGVLRIRLLTHQPLPVITAIDQAAAAALVLAATEVADCRP